MTIRRHIQLLCTMSVAVTLAACSEQPASPASPSRLETSAPSAAGRSASGSTPHIEGVTTASAPAASASATSFEIKFMTDMIDHHHMAVMMANMCIAKAVHSELRVLCESIQTSQMTEIERMQAWLQEWYGISYEPVMKPGDRRMMDRLASLSAAEFEIAFMEMMIKHHEKAIKEARHCLDRATHTELHSLCTNIITTQSEEIAQMQAWLCQWYGQCR